MKTALVTGASTGIGRAVAIALSENYQVLLVARSQNKLQETAKIISNKGGKAIVMTADLSDLTSINKLISSIKNNYDFIDAIINVAAIWHGKDEVYAGKNFQDFDQQTVLDTYMVGFTAPTLLVHSLLPKMPERSKVVNISGTFNDGGKGWLPYFASKRGLEDFTIGLAQELEDKNIQVNAISPSDTATDAYKKFFPQYIDEAIDPRIIAEEIIKLCSSENTTTGQVFVVKKDKPVTIGFHA